MTKLAQFDNDTNKIINLLFEPETFSISKQAYFNGDDLHTENEYEQILIKVAEWCNNNGQYNIEESKDNYYVTKKYEPSINDKKLSINKKLSQYINNISWKVERYNTQKELGIETTDSKEIYIKILEYMQYCRDFNKQDCYWDKTPKTFDEFIS